MVEDLVLECGTELITGHILKDACTNNLDFDGIMKDIKTAVAEAINYKDSNALTINLI